MMDEIRTEHIIGRSCSDMTRSDLIFDSTSYFNIIYQLSPVTTSYFIKLKKIRFAKYQLDSAIGASSAFKLFDKDVAKEPRALATARMYDKLNIYIYIYI
jgi:hypothetical protein